MSVFKGLSTGIVISLIFLANACTFLSELDNRFTLDKLDTLDAVDQIKIYLNGYPQSDLIKIIDDPEQIGLIVKTFRKYANNWKIYIPTTPPAPLIIHFYYKGKIQAVVNIGYTDQTSSKNTIFYLSQPLGTPGRPLEKQDFEELIQVLEVEENLAHSD